MIKNIFSLFIFQGVTYIVPLIITPYLVRILGLNGFGQLSFALGIISYTTVIIDFGFNLLISNKISINRNDKNYISELYSVTLFSKCLLCMVCFTTIMLLTLLSSTISDVRTIIIFSSLQLVGSVLVPLWLFQGLEKMSWFSFLGVCSRLLCLPMIFVFVKKPDDIYLAGFFQGLSLFVAGVSSLFIVRSLGIKLKKVSFTQIIDNIKSALPIFTGTFAISLYTITTTIILGFMASTSDVGLFSGADKLRAALLALFLIMGNVFYPRVCYLFSRDKLDGFIFVKNLIKWQLMLGSLVAILLFITAPILVNFYLGSQFEASITNLRIMSPMIILVPLSVILSNYLLLPLGHKDYFSKVPIITSIFHLCYVFILCYYFKSYGASIAIMITETISFMLLVLINLRLGYLNQIFLAKTF